MEKIWLKHYPKDVPHEIDFNPKTSLVGLFEEAVTKYATKPANECMGKTLSYQELDLLSTDFASYCQNVLELTKGDKLGIMSPNLLQYHIALFGALKAGLVVVGINPMYTPKELEYQFQDSGIKALVALDFFGETIERTLKLVPVEHVILMSVGDCHDFPKRQIINFVVKHVKKAIKPFHIPQAIQFRDTLKQGASQTFTKVSTVGNDLGFLQYTGGTTGKSKGVMLTHSNIVSNILQVSTALRPLVLENEIWLAPLPMFHIFALTASFVPLYFGHKNVFVPNPRDLPTFIKIAKSTPFTVMTGVNTLFSALAHNPDFQTGEYSSLKMTWAGGMPVQKHVAEKWHEVTGCVLHVAYGLSETSPGVSADFYNTPKFSESIGHPLPSTNIEIRNVDTNEMVPIGESGEICVKGPQVMPGYWNKPEETEKALIDGWLKTGDIGIMDETGRVKIVDRVKDMVIISGFNVYTVEVEHVISLIPEVLDVAIIGLPSKRSGELLKAHIILKPERHLTAEQVIKHCREHLTRYKVPKLIAFNEALPLSPVGKILKTELRKLPENIKHVEQNQ